VTTSLKERTLEKQCLGEIQRAIAENEILRLSKEGMTAGEIAKALTPIGKSVIFGKIRDYVRIILDRFEAAE